MYHVVHIYHHLGMLLYGANRVILYYVSQKINFTYKYLYTLCSSTRKYTYVLRILLAVELNKFNKHTLKRIIYLITLLSNLFFTTFVVLIWPLPRLAFVYSQRVSYILGVPNTSSTISSKIKVSSKLISMVHFCRVGQKRNIRVYIYIY